MIYPTKRNLKEFDLLNQIFEKGSRISELDQLCDFLAKTIHQLIPEGYVAISVFDPECNSVKVRSVWGLGHAEDQKLSMLSVDPLSIEGKITDMGEEAIKYQKQFLSGKLEHIEEGIFPLVSGMMSKVDAKSIEKKLDITSVFTVGFALDEKPYGGVSILLKKNRKIRKKKLIEFIARYFSVLIHRLAAEKSLRKSKETYEKRVETSLNGLWEIDETGHTTYASGKLAKILGYTPDEMKMKEVLDFVYEEDHEEAIRLFDRRQKGVSEINDIRLKHKSGQVIWARCAAVPYMEDKKFMGLLASVSNISEYVEIENALRNSEEKFRTLFNTAADAILIFSVKSGIIVEVNKEACRLFGYTREEFLNNISYKALGLNNIDEVAGHQYSELKKSTAVRFETNLKVKNEKVIPAELTAKRISYNNEECIYIVNRDLSAIHQAEKKYKELANHLQNIREEQNAYIAREIHDDLGQSLTALKMNLSIIEQDLPLSYQDSKRKYIKETIEDMVQILNQTINKIRNLSKELWPSILDTAGIIESLKVLVEDFEDYSNISTFFITDLVEVEVEKNKSLAIYRIVQGALNNIAQHSGANKVKVNIKLYKNTLFIKISDNGMGFAISEKDQYRSFGIMSMQELAAMYSGHLHIRSRKNTGTSVFIKMPIK